ncbi:MAG: hypothetical protein ACI4VP_03815 [Clostridia bacterium]
MLVFFIVIILICLIIYFSKIAIEIEELKINTRKKINNFDYTIKLYLVLGKKIRLLRLKIDKEKIRKLKRSKLLKKIEKSKKIENLKNNSFKQNNRMLLDIIKNIKIKLEKLQIKATIGLNNVIVLSYLVAILDIIFSVLLSKYSLNLQKNNYNYEINPTQTNKSYLKISINCIITIKIANIINMIIKKRSEEKNERTSYRSFNGNCNAKYPRYG